ALPTPPPNREVPFISTRTTGKRGRMSVADPLGGGERALTTRVLPNGSRLSCGRPVRRRKGVGRQSVPARAQHSATFEAITARQLQALVRPRRVMSGTNKCQSPRPTSGIG